MKKILLIAFSFSLLCMAAAEMTAGVPKKETATETILEFTQEANQVMIEKKRRDCYYPRGTHSTASRSTEQGHRQQAPGEQS